MVLIMGHITRAGVASINNNSTFYAKVTENIVAVVLTVETHLANLAALWCEGRKDEEARKFLKEAQEPFLAMLGFAVRTTSSVRFVAHPSFCSRRTLIKSPSNRSRMTPRACITELCCTIPWMSSPVGWILPSLQQRRIREVQDRSQKLGSR